MQHTSEMPHDAALAAAPRARSGGISSTIVWRALVLLAGCVLAAGLPFALKNFFVFQVTLAGISALAILGLNLLTGVNGQFSLGHSAFYAIGAYTAAIMMNADIPYVWTLPAAGLVCLVSGFLFGLPALRLPGLSLALAVATPQLLKLYFLEDWTGGVQGISLIKPDAPSWASAVVFWAGGRPLNSDQWLYFFTLAVAALLYVCAANP